MIRTQIRLEPDEYLLAKKEAKTLGISMAEFVRRAVRQMLLPHGPLDEIRRTSGVRRPAFEPVHR